MLEGFSSNDIECETKAAIILEFFFFFNWKWSQGVRGACVKMGEDRRGHISLISLLY